MATAFLTKGGRKIPAQLRAASGGRLKINKAGKKFVMRAYSGGALHLADFPAPVVVDLNGLTIERQDLPTPFDHDLGNAIGRTSSIRVVAGGGLIVEGQLDDSPTARGVIAASKCGVTWEASIGAPVHEMEEYGPGETVTVNGRFFRGPVLVARKTKLQEISFVRRGADVDQTAVAIAARRKESTMTFQEWLADQGIEDETKLPEKLRSTLQAAYSAEHGDDEDIKEGDEPQVTAVRREHARVARIEHIAAAFPEIRATAIAKGWSADRTTQEVELGTIRASRATGSWIATGGGGHITSARHISAALLVRAGQHAVAEKAYGANVMEQSRPIHGASLVDIAAHALRIDGKTVPHNRNEMIRAALSGGSLPVALGDSANKSLEEAYRMAPASWRSWCKVKSAANFLPQTSLRPSFLGELSPLPDGAGIEHATVGEETYQWKLQTFARQLAIGRQSFINDELKVLEEALPAFGKAAARSLSNLVYSVLLAAGSSYFDSSLGNVLSGGGSVLSATSLATAIMQMRVMRDAEGNILDLVPAVLLVPPTLENTAKAVLQSTELLQTLSSTPTPTGNPVRDIVKLEVEPRIETGVTDPNTGTSYGGSTTRWYLFGSPVDTPMVVGFLEGREAPVTETFGFDADPNTLQMSMRVYQDFGAATGDYRAAQKSAGA